MHLAPASPVSAPEPIKNKPELIDNICQQLPVETIYNVVFPEVLFVKSYIMVDTLLNQVDLQLNLVDEQMKHSAGNAAQQEQLNKRLTDLLETRIGLMDEILKRTSAKK